MGEDPLNDEYADAIAYLAKTVPVPNKQGKKDMTDKQETKPWGDEEERECSLCGDTFIGMGNNPEPLAEFEDRCCDPCNDTKVIPARIQRMGWR